MSKTDLPFILDFVKLGMAQKYFIYFWQKNCRLFVLFVCFVCCSTLSDFGLLFFLIEALIELKKTLIRKNYSMYGLGIAQPLGPS